MKETPAPLPADEIRQILERRAQLLAKRPSEDLAEETVDVLVMQVGDEQYGVDMRGIREVHPFGGATQVPGLRPIWMGLVNLRGTLYPLLNTATYLGLNPQPAEIRHVVVLSSGGVVVGLLVDELIGLRSLAPAEIEPPIEGTTQTRSNAVSGITADLLLLLDVDALLADPALVVEEENFWEGV